MSASWHNFRASVRKVLLVTSPISAIAQPTDIRASGDESKLSYSLTLLFDTYRVRPYSRLLNVVGFRICDPLPKSFTKSYASWHYSYAN